MRPRLLTGLRAQVFNIIFSPRRREGAKNNHSVIPMKIGIQFFGVMALYYPWIPAFAGMTTIWIIVFKGSKATNKHLTYFKE